MESGDVGEGERGTSENKFLLGNSFRFVDEAEEEETVLVLDGEGEVMAELLLRQE